MGIGYEFTDLMNVIGYDFNDVNLLQTALTHSSSTNEMRLKGFRAESNEVLEFLGDAVLQIVISEHLYDKYSKRGEGFLTRLRQNIVCEATLAKIAEGIQLGKYLNVGTSEENLDIRSKRKVLADALEALIAAIYMDDRTYSSGIRYPGVILSLFDKEIIGAVKRGNNDYKTLLQNFVEKNDGSILRYVIMESGPEHQKKFYAEAYINNNKVGEGQGNTKRSAEMQAAKEALKLFGMI
jgi:ribonuclease-3